jgi:hypothetical protein
MKNKFYALILFLAPSTIAMQHPGMRLGQATAPQASFNEVKIMSFTEWIEAYKTGAIIALVSLPQRKLQPSDIMEFPHQPQQKFRFKKTHQPQAKDNRHIR